MNSVISCEKDVEISNEKFSFLKNLCQKHDFFKMFNLTKEIYKVEKIDDTSAIFFKNIYDEDDDELMVFLIQQTQENGENQEHGENSIILTSIQIEDEERINDLLEKSNIDRDQCNFVDFQKITIELTRNTFSIQIKMCDEIPTSIYVVFKKSFDNFLSKIREHLLNHTFEELGKLE